MTSVKRSLLAVWPLVLIAEAAIAGEGYPRADWAAYMPPGAHRAEGVATIVDERTIRVDYFTYDGTAPAVYFYLGETDTHGDFVRGIPIGPELERAYDDETVTVQLPEGQTLDGYGAISVWCAEFDVNFTSASFVCRGDLDGDGEVGLPDLATLLASYGAASGASHAEGDLDGDGAIDLADLAALLAVYGTACNPTMEMTFDGLEDLGDDYVYEGWLIVDGAPVSSGRFTIDGSGEPFPARFVIHAADAEAATLFVLTIEPAVGDDPAPAETHILAGALAAGVADLTIGHPAALGDDFAMAAGAYILETPSTADVADDYDQGIWWLDPAGGPGASLDLPELPPGWVYEGWVVGAGGPLTTGRFLTASGADDDGAGPTAGMDAGPPFPGQDFIDPPIVLTSGYAAVITVEPEPDNSPAPFTLKPLIDVAIDDVGPAVIQAMENRAADAPTGVVTIVP